MPGGLIGIILLFFFVRFLFRYVFPILRVFGNANRKMREMQQGNNTGTEPPSMRQSTPKKGDYIDYEEVK